MGTQKITVTVCDSCGRQRPIGRWRLTYNGVTRALDLCAECSAPLLRLHTKSGEHDLFTPVSDDEIAEARRRKAMLEGGR